MGRQQLRPGWGTAPRNRSSSPSDRRPRSGDNDQRPRSLAPPCGGLAAGDDGLASVWVGYNDHGEAGNGSLQCTGAMRGLPSTVDELVGTEAGDRATVAVKDVDVHCGLGFDGTRTLRVGSSKPLMARDFWRQPFWRQSIAGPLPFAAVTPSLLESTRVVETVWRQPHRLLPGPDRGQGQNARGAWSTVTSAPFFNAFNAESAGPCPDTQPFPFARSPCHVTPHAAAIRRDRVTDSPALVAMLMRD